MLAFIGNLDMTEMLVIALAALMIFGRRLPEVAMRGASQLVRLRRSVSKMWREAGLEEELRKVRRDIEDEVDRAHRELPPPSPPEIDPEDDREDEDWRESIHSEIPADEDPLAGEAFDEEPREDEPREEAVRQEDEERDPLQDSLEPAEEYAEEYLDEPADETAESDPRESDPLGSESPETGTKESA